MVLKQPKNLSLTVFYFTEANEDMVVVKAVNKKLKNMLKKWEKP